MLPVDHSSPGINPFLDVISSLILDINVVVEINKYPNVDLEYDREGTNEEKKRATEEANLLLIGMYNV